MKILKLFVKEKKIQPVKGVLKVHTVMPDYQPPFNQWVADIYRQVDYNFSNKMTAKAEQIALKHEAQSSLVIG